MLHPKKLIPALVGASLTITGCGSDESNPTGGDGGLSESVTAALRGFCVKLLECYSGTGYTVDYCVEYYAPYFEEVYTPGDQACESALISYFDCNAALACAQFIMGSSCDDEADAAYSACF